MHTQSVTYTMILGIMLVMSQLAAQTQRIEPDPRLIFYRDTGALKSATSCQIFVADSLLCNIGNQAAWTSTFPPGIYEFRSLMSIDKEAGNSLSITLESGMLYMVEVDLARTSGRHLLPSAGYYFRLKRIHPKRIKTVLARKSVSRAVQHALLQEMNLRYEVR
ncbi:MAG: hypothetical protein AAF587_43675 [Bacteroidota bacterium]